jgi:hypothetical protein
MLQEANNNADMPHVIGGIGALGMLIGRNVSYICINKSGFIRK